MPAKLAETNLASLPERTDRNMDFAFVAVSASDAASFEARAGLVADIASDYDGTVYQFVPVVVVGFNDVLIHPAPGDARQRFVNSVQARLPDAAAIVHGSITARVGNFGSKTRFNFSYWWPGALDALRHLATLAPGDAHELPIERSA